MTPERFAKLKRVLSRRQPDLTVLAGGVHKSHNVSAMLRSCDAVGIHRMHAVAQGGALRRHHMIAGGVGRWVCLDVHRSLDDAIASLRAGGWRLLAAHASEGAIDYRRANYTQKVAVVFGSELHGLDPAARAACDQSIAVPMHGMGASLNVSVAAAVILFEALRQREAAGLYGLSRLDPEEWTRTLFEWSYPDVAKHCRERSLPYPPLTEDGFLARDP